MNKQFTHWRRHIVALSSAFVIGLTLLPSAAYAAAPAASALQNRTESTTVNGIGTLSCSGNGNAVINMHGKLEYASLGDATLKLRGANTVSATGDGTQKQVGHWTLYQNWNGTVTVHDAHFQAHATGSDITFTARGKGHAWLKGQGSCTINGEPLALSETTQVIVGGE